MQNIIITTKRVSYYDIKKDDNLLNWIYENVIDFTDENDTSGLTWESSNAECLRYIKFIPKKDRVQKYGFFASKTHLFTVIKFDDIKEGLENEILSEKTCKSIYNLNKEVGRNNWNMDDVMYVLYPALGQHISRNFLYVAITNLIDLEVMECVNPHEKYDRLYRLTDKGRRVLGFQ